MRRGVTSRGWGCYRKKRRGGPFRSPVNLGVRRWGGGLRATSVQRKGGTDPSPCLDGRELHPWGPLPLEKSGKQKA